MKGHVLSLSLSSRYATPGRRKSSSQSLRYVLVDYYPKLMIIYQLISIIYLSDETYNKNINAIVAYDTVRSYFWMAFTDLIFL